eukprot:TRINITY_DN6327_c0_g1_i1.p1 TRINITY_DN6327_c0_g1~~TRINITY_DN6327_c0_g1_i1.p1  ORF type:complete len:225 (+),score=35.43 TRINITY_DN6327_c0_g1_i1:39-713(+)
MSAAQDESLKVVLGDIQASLDIERGETAALLSTLVQERDAALMAAHRAQRQALLLADARAAERQHIAAERNLLDTGGHRTHRTRRWSRACREALPTTEMRARQLTSCAHRTNSSCLHGEPVSGGAVDASRPRPSSVASRAPLTVHEQLARRAEVAENAAADNNARLEAVRRVAAARSRRIAELSERVTSLEQRIDRPVCSHNRSSSPRARSPDSPHSTSARTLR